jgi:hypothetical protein
MTTYGHTYGSPEDAVWTTYTVATPTKPTSVFPIDIDHDGDIDIVSCAETGTSSNGKVRWYVNDGTPDDGWTTNNIASSINKPSSVFVADIDNDGNLDVVSSAYNDDEIAWYESTAIPEFSNIMMPIVSVLAIVGLNYRRRH